MEQKLKYVIESLLFVAETPLTIDRINNIIPEAERQDIKFALAALGEEYELRGGSFFLSEVAHGYQLRTRSDFGEWIKRMKQPNPLKLTKAALETLSIVAYKQPVMRSDIEHIRGVDSGGVVRMLLEKKLIKVLGRKEIPGRPLIYSTTKYFLEVFDLKDLKDLPTPEEIEEMGRQSQETEAASTDAVSIRHVPVQEELF